MEFSSVPAGPRRRALHRRGPFLAHEAEEVGYHPHVIHSGRRVNDGMGMHVASRVARSIMRRASDGRPVVTVLGATFKESVPDIRDTRVVDIVRELEDFGITVQLHDPEADGDLLREEYGLKIIPFEGQKPADAIVLAVAHRPYRDGGWSLIERLVKPGAFVADVPALLDRRATPAGVTLWRLQAVVPRRALPGQRLFTMAWRRQCCLDRRSGLESCPRIWSWRLLHILRTPLLLPRRVAREIRRVAPSLARTSSG